MDSPILKIKNKRYTMGRLKAGTYRQVVLLSEDWPHYSEDELVEDARVIVADAFGLSKELAEQIDMEAVMPVFRKIKELAECLFIARSEQIPNESGPEEKSDPGQS